MAIKGKDMMLRFRLVPLAVIVLFCSLYVLTAIQGNAQTPFSCADVTEIPTSECEVLVPF